MFLETTHKKKLIQNFHHTLRAILTGGIKLLVDDTFWKAIKGSMKSSSANNLCCRLEAATVSSNK